MQQKSELPEGWAWTTVGESYTLVGGGTPSTKNQEYWNGSIPWISSADIYGLKDIQPRKFVTKLGVDNSSTNIVPENSIIVVTRVGLGKICLTSYPLCFSQDSQALIGNPSLIFPDYVLYYLSVAVKDFKYNNRGTTISGVPKKQLAEIQIPLPPLPEQHRIVSAIEALFARLDAANEKLDRVLEILKKFRQSVLAVACDGRLTEEWRKENKILNEWKNTTLSQIGKWSTGGTPSRKNKEYFGGDVHWVKSGDLNDSIVTNTEEKITKKGLENSSAKLLPAGTISIALYGATIGKLGILNIDAATNQACANCIPDKTIVDTRFLFYYLLQQRKDLIDAGQGGAQPNLTNQIVREWPIFLPPIIEQEEIVRRVDALFTFADSVEAKVSASREKTEKLRQSILTKAFSGQLVETEAEIARREGRDYETAEVLIERIKKERGKEGKKR
ncbi:MAG: restriction endonuclease subunit S [Euryarchaeota archaeon]|nr:restriction endonuclease subunit S [Euryarchaeota archaeon]